MAAGDIKDAGPHNPIRQYQASVGTQAAVATVTTVERDITVTGVETGDILLSVVKPTAQAGLGIAGARIKAANTISIIYVNPTAGAVTPTADEVYLFTVVKGA